jgi:hypothetical protein
MADSDDSTDRPNMAELQSYMAQKKRLQSALELMAEIDMERPQSRQFEKDIDSLFFHQINPNWHKPYTPESADVIAFKSAKGIKGFNISPRAVHLARRLPLGPLRRIAGLIGVRNLRHIFDLAQPNGHSKYLISVRERKAPEKPDKGKLDKRVAKQIAAKQFGQAVLKFESLGADRKTAMQLAAAETRLPGDRRTWERRYKDFVVLCRKEGFVPSPHNYVTNSPPRVSLSALKAKPGRKKRNSDI